jgi:hypothetical protein
MKTNYLGKYLRKIAVAKTAAFPKSEIGRGKVIGYCDAPTVIIEKPDGTQFTWRADLCEFYEEDESVTAKVYIPE